MKPGTGNTISVIAVKYLENLPLFDEEPSFDRKKLAAKLRNLAQQGIYFGGSSWKYEGWLGQVYTPSAI